MSFCNLSRSPSGTGAYAACLPGGQRVVACELSASKQDCWESQRPPWAFLELAELTLNLEGLPGRFLLAPDTVISV